MDGSPDQQSTEHQVREGGVFQGYLFQAIQRQPQHLTGLTHDSGQQGRLTGEQTELTDEATGAVHADRLARLVGSITPTKPESTTMSSQSTSPAW